MPCPQSRFLFLKGPSIAVLPFQNMSGDREQDYFAEDGRGHRDRIVADQVALRDRPQLERRLRGPGRRRPAGRTRVGVRYLEGGVRKSGRRLRITAQLVEAETGAHLWADKFDGQLEDVFDLQDRITDQVVGIVEPRVQKSEIERSRRKRPESLGAYDLYLRALPFVQSLDPDQLRLPPDFLAMRSKPIRTSRLRNALPRIVAPRSASCAPTLTKLEKAVASTPRASGDRERGGRCDRARHRRLCDRPSRQRPRLPRSRPSDGRCPSIRHRRPRIFLAGSSALGAAIPWGEPIWPSGRFD